MLLKRILMSVSYLSWAENYVYSFADLRDLKNTKNSVLRYGTNLV